MLIVTVVGARPQFIKAAVLSRALKRFPEAQELIVHTGQHYDEDMSEIFFRELKIPAPKYNLGVGSGPHGQQTGRMIEAIEKLLIDLSPDCVVVYGDTNSTLAGALAATKLHFKVAHVEAGLRSFNRSMPEEINRVLCDHIAELLFAPTDVAVENLRKEGVSESRIHLVGDVMYDAAIIYGRGSEDNGFLKGLGLRPREYVLATIHRQENTDDPVRLKAIFDGLAHATERIPVVLPLHPRTRAALLREGLLEAVQEKLLLTDPVGYMGMVCLEKNASLIATDSGGVQKEAYFHRIPCVTLRDETEWVELLQAGWNKLVSPTTAESVRDAVLGNLHVRGQEVNLYGGGEAAFNIASVLLGRE